MPKRRRLLRSDIVREIRRLAVEEELTVQHLSERYSLPYFTVYSIVRGWTYKKLGGGSVDRKSGKLTPEKVEEIRRLRKEGASIQTLVEKSGCCKTTVRKALSGGV